MSVGIMVRSGCGEGVEGCPLALGEHTNYRRKPFIVASVLSTD